jgi:hypothetical protein
MPERSFAITHSTPIRPLEVVMQQQLLTGFSSSRITVMNTDTLDL